MLPPPDFNPFNRAATNEASSAQVAPPLGTFWTSSTTVIGSKATSSSMLPPDFDSFSRAAANEATNAQVTPALGGFGQPVVNNQHRGSRLVPFSPKFEPSEHDRSGFVPGKFASISAMDVYSDKSHEEFRFEDYQQSSGGHNRDEANFGDSRPCFASDIPSHNQQTGFAFHSGNSTQFGMPSGVTGSIPTSGASATSRMPHSSGRLVFGSSSSAFGSTTTSAAFGSNSTPFPTHPFICCGPFEASEVPIPDISFSKLNIEETPSSGGRRDEASFGDSRPCFASDTPSHNQQTGFAFPSGNSTQFGMSSGVTGRFPSLPTSGASASSGMSHSNGTQVFGASSSAFGSTTTSAAFGGISTLFNTQPAVCFGPFGASSVPIPENSFSKLNVQETPSFGGCRDEANFGDSGPCFASDMPKQNQQRKYCSIPLFDMSGRGEACRFPSVPTSGASASLFGPSSSAFGSTATSSARGVNSIPFPTNWPFAPLSPSVGGSAAADFCRAVAKFGESPLTSDNLIPPPTGKLKLISETLGSTAGPSSSSTQDKPNPECFRCSNCNYLNFFAQTSRAMFPTSYYSGPPLNWSGPGAYTNSPNPIAYHAQDSNVGLTYPAFEASSNPASTSDISPSSVPFGSTVHFGCSTGVFGSPFTSFNGANGPTGAQSPASQPSPFGHFGPHPYSSCTSFGGLNNKTKGEPSTRSGSITNPELAKKESDSCAPKGLETIVESLGFNPWAKSSNREDKAALDYPPIGSILFCEEADKDADIIALAEFAIEQHNAMDKDEKVVLFRVVGACLEAVSGGRYHIVLEAIDRETAHICGKPKKYYAVVIRHLSHLTVLEKWLPGKA